MIKAVLADLDGVLFSGCEIHYLALNQALKTISSIEISRQRHENTFNGLPTKVKLNILSQENIIKSEDINKICSLKQELTKEIIEKYAKLDYEKIELLKNLRDRNIKTACITNSIRETALMMLEKTGQLQFLEFVISNEDVKNSKPHGEGYIRAMIRLGVMPEETLIIEDSDKGIQAAKSTGAYLMIVKNETEVNLENINQKIKSIEGN